MSQLITQHLSVVEQSKTNPEVDIPWHQMYIDFQTELTRLQASNQAEFRSDLHKITTILAQYNPSISEALRNYLVECLIHYLKIWRASIHFQDPNDAITLQNLSTIITLNALSEKNELLVEELIQCLYAIARGGKDMFTNRNIEDINRLFVDHTRLASNYKRQFMDRSPVDDAVIACLLAPYCLEVVSQFKSSVTVEERTAAEKFLFDGLFDYVSIMNREELGRRPLELRQHWLPSIRDLLGVYATSSDDWAQSAVIPFEPLTNLFLYAVQMTVPNDLHLDVQMHLCDTSLKVLLNPVRSFNVNNNCLQYIYMGTLNDKILDHLKNAHLADTMLKFTRTYNAVPEMQFNAYRILAAIMTEDDIKCLEDPGSVAKIFLDQLDMVKERTGWEVRMKNLLTTLKILLQHDQIRDEIYKQSGISLFIYCATTDTYEPLIRQRALENLLIMSFKVEVCKDLKANTEFMAHLNAIANSSAQPDLQRAAESLLWVLTKDDASKTSSTEGESSSNTQTYNIMISYSHKDEDLCFRLYDRLQQDQFRVWLDRDQMHGTPLEAMSSAIEQAEFVFVCMSDAYKQSGYCKMEAYYALERQCSIIPIVMKAQYKPDGWLGIVVTGRMRIDFPKYGFEEAYKKLLVEMERSRKEERQEPLKPHHDLPSTSKQSSDIDTSVDATVKKIVFQMKSDHTLPLYVSKWTNEDVQQFFLQKQLDNFLPVCSSMDGKQLFSTYQMCLTNSPVMLHSLNQEIMNKKKESRVRTIDLVEYLKFMDDIKPFVPISFEKREIVTIQSALCAIL